MTTYIAIIEDAGPETAVGVWFPDLPGCFSAGDDIDEALHNAHEALLLYAEALEAEGRTLPAPRSITELRSDPVTKSEIGEHLVALISLPRTPVAAE